MPTSNKSKNYIKSKLPRTTIAGCFLTMNLVYVLQDRNFYTAVKCNCSTTFEKMYRLKKCGMGYCSLEREWPVVMTMSFPNIHIEAFIRTNKHHLVFLLIENDKVKSPKIRSILSPYTYCRELHIHISRKPVFYAIK